MAHARRRQQRALLVAHAGLVWRMFDAPPPAALEEYIRCGVLPDLKAKAQPYDPEVERIAAQIEANGGKLIFEEVGRGSK